MTSIRCLARNGYCAQGWALPYHQILSGEALEEIAPGVFKYARLNDEHAGDICFYYFHFQILLLHLYQTCLYIGYACGIRQFLE